MCAKTFVPFKRSITKSDLKRAVMKKMRKNGFTLIELLVVIAIIALLLAVIVPSLNIAKKKAEEVICRSNLHHLPDLDHPAF